MSSLRASQLKRGCLPKVDGDHTVAVTAQLEIAQGKVPLLPAAAAEAAAQRMSAQLPTAEKVARADFVIFTDGSFEETERQIDAVVAALSSDL